MNVNTEKSEYKINRIMRDIKACSGRGVSRILGDRGKVWEPGIIKHKVESATDFQQSLELMHEDPVKNGLVNKPDEYLFSSYLYYVLGEGGAIPITTIDQEVKK